MWESSFRRSVRSNFDAWRLASLQKKDAKPSKHPDASLPAWLQQLVNQSEADPDPADQRRQEAARRRGRAAAARAAARRGPDGQRVRHVGVGAELDSRVPATYGGAQSGGSTLRSGARVSRVMAGSAAAEGGLRVGDLVMSVGGVGLVGGKAGAEDGMGLLRGRPGTRVTVETVPKDG